VSAKTKFAEMWCGPWPKFLETRLVNELFENIIFTIRQGRPSVSAELRKCFQKIYQNRGLELLEPKPTGLKEDIRMDAINAMLEVISEHSAEIIDSKSNTVAEIGLSDKKWLIN
jgi:hypothetical protein